MDRNRNRSDNHRRNNKSQPHAQSSNNGHDVRLSRALSHLLRHGAPQENVTIHPGGFVDVDEILGLNRFNKHTVDEIRAVVTENDKQRFTLTQDANTGKLRICANQGHSFEIEDPQLDLITDPAEYPKVIHGTYVKCWDSIRRTGLSRMNRIHIHFAPGVVGSDDGVISGMRRSAEMFIYVDLAKAMQDGIKFYKSRNNVILTPGNEKGVLEVKYFKKVENVKTKETLKL